MSPRITTFFCVAVLICDVCFAEDIHKLQRQSAVDLPYGWITPGAVAMPGVSKLEALRSRRWAERNFASNEYGLLYQVFGEQWDLWAIARRDSDGDGVYDYRVNTIVDEGRFYEGDRDIDDDGYPNVQDANPFDPDVGIIDRNNNGINDAIDWRLTRIRESNYQALVAIQERLFKKYDVLLFERSAKFSLSAAQAISDCIDYLYSEKMKTLKQISAEDFGWLRPDEDETNAMVFTPSQSMMIFQSGLEFHPFFQLGLFAHELAHSYQYALDWEDDDKVEFARNYFEMPNFKKLVARYGWKARRQDLEPWKSLTGFASLAENKSTFLYRNKKPQWWAEWIHKIYNKVGNGYLDVPKVVKKGIVGEYSLIDPLEWHADQLCAYLLNAIADYYFENVDASEEEIIEMKAKLREIEYATWPTFRHQNVEYSPIYQRFQKEFPLSKPVLKKLADRYLAPYLQVP